MLRRRTVTFITACVAALVLVPGVDGAHAAVAPEPAARRAPAAPPAPAAPDGSTTEAVSGRALTVAVDDAEHFVAATRGRRPTVRPTHRQDGGLVTRTFVEARGRLLDVPAGSGPRVAGARTGDRFALTVGRRPDGTTAVVAARPAGRGYSVAGAQVAASATAAGVHTLTVLPVYFATRDAQTTATLGTLATRTAAYWGDQSGGALDVRPAVRDWKQVTDPGSCNTTSIFNAALAAHGVAAPTSTNHVVVYFPTRSDCGGWAGLGSIGGGAIWVNGYPLLDVFTHELGHNLGIGHANTASCTSGGARVAYSDTCTVNQYYDTADVMGFATTAESGNLNTAFADYLGMARVTTATAGTATTATLAPLAEVTANRAVKIPLANGSTVFVDYRPAAGRDVRQRAWAGVQVHLRVDSNPPSTQLLDMQAPATAAWSATSLPAWAVWPVPGTGLAVKVTGVTASAATVSVVPTLGDTTAPAKVTPTAPVADRTVVPGSTLTWPATGDTGTGTAAYAVLVDGTLRARVGAATTAWTLPVLPDGGHTVRVDATDEAGNTTAGTTVSFTVSRTAAAAPPRLLSPAAGAWTGSAVAVAWALDTPAASAVLVDGVRAVTVPAGTTTATVTGLGDGAHTVAVAVLDAAGATTATSAPVAVTTDTAAPSAPGGLVVAGTRATWTASTDATSGVAGYRVSLDGRAPVTTTSTSLTFVVTDGAHTLSVAAVDRAGNRSEPVTAAFVRDATPPTGLTVTAPAAGALLASRAVRVAWSAAADSQSDIAGYRVTVPGRGPLTVDAATLAADVTLPEGRSTVKVAAVNGAGVVAEQSVQVTVDSVAPAAPRGLALTLDGTRLAWTHTRDAGTPTRFSVVVDDAEPVTTTATTLALTLAPGRHVAAVTAVDAAGNASPTTSLTRWVDTSPPSAPALTSPADGAVPAQRTLVVEWTAAEDAESGVTGYQVSVAGRRVAVTDGVTTRVVVTAPADGRVGVAVTALNAAGLAGPAASRTVLVDTLAPAPPARLATTPAGALVWTAPSDRGSPTAFSVSVDGGAAQPAVSPWTAPAGRHTFAVRTVDAAGNASAPASLTAWVDPSGPAAPVVLSPAPPAATAATVARTPVGARSVQLTWAAATDADSGVAAYRVSVGGRLVATAGGDAGGVRLTLPEGPSTVAVTPVNLAGVAGEPAVLPLLVDTVRPGATGAVTVTPAANGSGDVLGWAAAVDAGTGSGVAGYVVRLDGVDVAKVAPDAGTTLAVSTPAGTHVWSVAAVDAAGNLSRFVAAAAVTR